MSAKSINEILLKAVQTLHSGGVVLHPTETCYGLANDVFSEKGWRRLCAIKGMSLDKPVSLLVQDLEEAQRYGVFSDLAVELATLHWPGALTLIVPKTKALPLWLNPGIDTVGLRVSSNRKTADLLKAFGGPISTTSANLSGQVPAYSVEEFLNQGIEPDFIVNAGRIGPTPPSTLVRVLGDSIEVLRDGPVKIDGFM